ncbi:MAG: helix-turn-helix transcriptional regulator [Clostridia bacterium]|nr:helix-turn-helix transcriptional regulator [Clostridia bacterium]
MNDGENICLFVPSRDDTSIIKTLHFVLEKIPASSSVLFSKPTFIVYTVKEGSGKICFPMFEYSFSVGDVFFSFPNAPFRLKTESEKLQLYYISFVGPRAANLLNSLDISFTRCVFPNHGKLLEFWENSFAISHENNLGIISEAVLLYTLSVLAPKNPKPQVKSSQIALEIVKTIDKNYTNHDMSLQFLSDIFHYDQKYISKLISKELAVSFTDYLRSLRAQHACMLIDNGFRKLEEISQLCGYNDPSYFSKVFKKAIKMSPSEYIRKAEESSDDVISLKLNGNSVVNRK